MQHKGKVGFGFGGEHTSWSKAVVVNQGWVVAAFPFHRIRRVGDNGIKGFVVAKMRVDQGIAQQNIELVVVDVMQKHVHTRQIVGGVIDLLSKKALFNDVGVKVLLGLQQQGAGTTGGVINFIDAGLLGAWRAGQSAWRRVAG